MKRQEIESMRQKDGIGQVALLLAVFFLLSCSKKNETICQSKKSKSKVIAFGDSNNKYAPYLKQRLDAGLFQPIVNYSFSGYTFERASSLLLDTILPLYDTTNLRNIILVMFGTNDLRLDLPMDSIKARATSLFHTLKNAGFITIAILPGKPPYGKCRTCRDSAQFVTAWNDFTIWYNQAWKETLQADTLVSLYGDPLIGEQTNSNSAYYRDEVHYTLEGYKRIAEVLAPVLIKVAFDHELPCSD